MRWVLRELMLLLIKLSLDAGKKAIEDLVHQTSALLNGRPVKVEGKNKQIAFNAIPHIDTFQDNRYTKEEMKMVWETKKILDDETIMVNPTAVRIPVFYGHSEAVHIETKQKITQEEVTDLMKNAPGVIVMDERIDGGYATPFSEATNNDATYVSRIREDISHDKGLNLWVVSDNIRKGAALNTVQIAEIFVKKYLLRYSLLELIKEIFNACKFYSIFGRYMSIFSPYSMGFNDGSSSDQIILERNIKYRNTISAKP